MAKRRAKKAVGKGAETPTGKVALQLRMDATVHQRLTAAAEEAEISLNQLVGGLCRWASERMHQGEPTLESGIWEARRQPGCVFIGSLGQRWDVAYQEACREQTGEDPGEAWKGEIFCRLDFTERHVVRED